VNWMRVPPWCMAVHDQANAARARAWVYLLGAWHAGDDPSTREVRRVTGFGGGRAEDLVAAVAAWAIENGAAIPARVAGQYRGTTGAEAGQAEVDPRPIVEPQRGTTGAVAGQERGAHGRVLLSEREEREPEGGIPRAPDDSTRRSDAVAPPSPSRTGGGLPPDASTPRSPDVRAVGVGAPALPPDLDALMPEAGLGFAMKLQRAGIDTPADLLAMTLDELAHSGGIGPAIARKVQRELAKGPWRLAEPVARGSPRPRGSPPTEGAPPAAPPPIPPGSPRQPTEDIGRWHTRRTREIEAGIRHLDGSPREVPHV
jgi:hypothetical protein